MFFLYKSQTYTCEAVELPGRSWPLAEGGAPEHKYTAGIIYSIIILVQLYSVYILASICTHIYSPVIMGPEGPDTPFSLFAL